MKSRTPRVGSPKGKRPRQGQRLRLEQLERRDLMTASPFDPASPLSGAICTCPLCSGNGLSQVVSDSSPSVSATSVRAADAPADATFPITNLPLLSSNPGATATIVLDFDGNTLANWYTFTNANTPVYDIDGDATTFSTQELANIREIWTRVSEDYAPFNVNVTTVDPGVLIDRAVCKVAIGGANSDWYGSATAGGVALLGAFTNASLENVGFAFTANLNNGNAKTVAEAVSHEAGHMFGLQHQSEWFGNTLINPYSQGNSAWAPIMGVGYYSAVTTWYNGPTPQGPFAFQDDMSILANANNGFGYRTNSIGTAATAASLGTTGTATINGIIAQNGDRNYYEFSTAGGLVSFNVNTIGIGANLDSVLEIQDASGTVLFTANSAFNLNSRLNVALGAGTYYAVVRSTTVYGYVGQYTMTALFNPATIGAALPEITVLQGATTIDDGGSYSFGSTTVGTFVDRTFTVRNDGGNALVLKSIDTSNFPADFSIISNFAETTLQTGQSTTFTVRMTAATAGSFSGVIRLSNNDPDETVYDINISGTVTPLPALVTLSTIDNGDATYVGNGAWTTNVGAGYGKDFAFAQPTAATSVARWTAINLAPGTYRVSATWVAFAKAASNARFYFGDDTGTLGSKLINERLQPTGLSAGGSVWQTVATVTITAGHQQIWVQLNNKNVDGFVVADAIRFERIATLSLPAKAAVASSAAASSNVALAQYLADEAMGQYTRRK
jgi:hypothetical protein